MDSTPLASVGDPAGDPAAAQTPESDVIVIRRLPQYRDYPKANYETKAEETLADILEDPPQKIEPDDCSAGISWDGKENKKRRDGWIEETPPDTVTYDLIQEEPLDVAEAVHPQPPSDPDLELVAEACPPPVDPHEELAPEEAPPAPDEEPQVDAWAFWGAPKKPGQKKKGEGTLNLTSPVEPTDSCLPSPEISKDCKDGAFAFE